MTGHDLKAWRTSHGYTHMALAEELGVHHMTIYRWEVGLRRIPAMVDRLLDALDVIRAMRVSLLRRSSLS